MSAQALASELTALVQDSKRKNLELRSAAEKSLADLKALPNTSEAQLASDLKRRPQFVKPFLMGCASKNPKLAGPSIAGLQRLVLIQGLHQDTLKEVLDALRECTALSQDVQLRILQLLPSLLQNYGKLVLDDLLVVALHICFLLLASKNATVSNTAAATLQQVVITVFDRVVQEDTDDLEGRLVQDVPVENGWVSVRRAALDTYRLLNDLCLLIDGQTPEFLVAAPFQANFGLELIESILTNHAAVVVAHPELIQILRSRLLPFIIRALSEKIGFSITVRSLRLLPVIFGRMLLALDTECEMLLSLINHMLDPDAGVLWKRVLCMELLKTIHSDQDLIKRIFSQFDGEAGRRNIVQDQMGVMVRLASEKPSVIGLGQSSSTPYASSQNGDDPDQMAALQAEGISGTIGVAMTVRASTAHGISSKLSSMKVPCLEQLDKTEPPSIPPSYLYSLSLACMNSFSEGLAKFLLPFTVPNDTRSRRRAQTKDNDRMPQSPGNTNAEGASIQSPLKRSDSESLSKIPVNPMDLKTHPNYDQILTCSAMVDTCWPALLAAYSTYLHAALDSEIYRGLIRSFQKFTQVAGLLRLSVPRDAFLTTLSKNAMPNGQMSLLRAQGQELKLQSLVPNESQEKDTMTEGANERRKLSSDEPQASLNSRNLLCLRALLNLGIALGPVLEKAWPIILEALQHVDFLIGHISSQRRKIRTGSSGIDEAELLADVSNEIAAVGSAATRLFESTGELTEKSYLAVISALCGLFRDIDPERLHAAGAAVMSSRRNSAPADRATQSHDPRLNIFVVDQLTKIIKLNEFRFHSQLASTNGWFIISQSLQAVVSATHLTSDLRIRAAKTLLAMVSFTASPDVLAATRDQTRLHGLQELQSIVEITAGLHDDSGAAKPCEEEIQILSLEAMRSMLELYGESLIHGWEHVFAIIISVFNDPLDEKALYPAKQDHTITCKSLKSMRSSFISLQLICSDFLLAVPQPRVKTMVVTIRAFVDQRDDFNMALTALPLYANIAGLLWNSSNHIMLQGYDETALDDIVELLTSESLPAIFLQLLLSLVAVSTDSRPEIRHGAIHTLFRILDNHADYFEGKDWLACLNVVIMTFFTDNESAYNKAPGHYLEDATQADSWNESATLLLENTSTLVSLRLPELVPYTTFSTLWARLLDHLQRLLQRRWLALSVSVFAALEKTLVALGNISKSEKNLRSLSQAAWRLWTTGNPAQHKARLKIIDNQPALLAYVSCLQELHQIDKDFLKPDQLRKIAGQIYDCAAKSSPVSYAADIDSLSPLQAELVGCLNAFDVDSVQQLSIVTGVLSSLIVLPFEKPAYKPGQKGPTYVALSKQCTELLESKLVIASSRSVPVDHRVLTVALKSLRRPISLKYAWSAEGKGPSTWRKATVALVAILEAALPRLDASQMTEEDHREVWKEILESCAAVMTTGVNGIESEIPPPADLTFDITSFSNLFRLMVPALGSSRHSDDTRRVFARMLYDHSMIHEAHPDDLPEPDQEPLASISSVHIGRTRDIAPSTRGKMGYRLLDALFDLTADHGESAEYVRLAQATAPFLILRVSLTIKAFVLDHPLRGRMPQPASERKELLYILRRLVELESEPKAIPDAPGMSCKHKKHLYWVYDLVTKALPVSKRDQAINSALIKMVEAVAQDLGI